MKKDLPIYANGSEDIEITATADVLARGGIAVVHAALGDNCEVKLAHGTRVHCDLCLKDADDRYDVIVIPGGLQGALDCSKDETLLKLLHAQKESGRLIAAICAAPGFVLARNGILENERATGYPGCDDEIKNCTGKGVEISENGQFITGKGPAFSMQFALAVLKQLEGPVITEKVAEGMLF